MKTPKFVTSRGWLTVYALSCGYIETNKGWKEERKVSMWHEGACFHVRKDYLVHGAPTRWQCFGTLSEARKAFKIALLQINAKRKNNKG